MSDFRLVSAQLFVEFELYDERFEALFSSSHNGLDEWLSLLKAKESGENTDPLTLKLLTEILRKLENIENMLERQNSTNALNEHLANTKTASKIGYEGFCFDEDCLKSGELYFASVRIKGFVRKNIKLFFRAKSKRLAKIERISKFDEKEWAQNVARCEMSQIRQTKHKKDE